MRRLPNAIDELREALAAEEFTLNRLAWEILRRRWLIRAHRDHVTHGPCPVSDDLYIFSLLEEIPDVPAETDTMPAPDACTSFQAHELTDWDKDLAGCSYDQLLEKLSFIQKSVTEFFVLCCLKKAAAMPLLPEDYQELYDKILSEKLPRPSEPSPQ